MRESILKFRGVYQEETSASPLVCLMRVTPVVDRIIGELTLAQNGILALHACPRQEAIESIANRTSCLSSSSNPIWRSLRTASSRAAAWMLWTGCHLFSVKPF